MGQLKHTQAFLNWFSEQNGIQTGRSTMGAMDGWHGDEYDCTGHCGVCDECERARERQCDDAIEAMRQEPSRSHINECISE